MLAVDGNAPPLEALHGETGDWANVAILPGPQASGVGTPGQIRLLGQPVEKVLCESTAVVIARAKEKDLLHAVHPGVTSFPAAAAPSASRRISSAVPAPKDTHRT